MVIVIIRKVKEPKATVRVAGPENAAAWQASRALKPRQTIAEPVRIPKPAMYTAAVPLKMAPAATSARKIVEPVYIEAMITA